MIDWENTLRRCRRDMNLEELTDRETLAEIFRVHRTPQGVADILCVSAPSVRNKMKSLGIPIPKFKRFSKLDGIEFGDKLPKELALETGLTVDRIYRYAKAHNIDTRWRRDPHYGRPWDKENYWLDDPINEHHRPRGKYSK